MERRERRGVKTQKGSNTIPCERGGGDGTSRQSGEIQSLPITQLR